MLVAVVGPRLSASASVKDGNLGQRCPEAATATPEDRIRGGRPLHHLSHGTLPL